MTSEDKDDILSIAAKYRFDYIQVPNVTSVKDLSDVKFAKQGPGDSIGVIAKIDNLEAVH